MTNRQPALLPCLVAGLLLTLPAFAAPTADELLQNWVKAIGGRAALEKITSRTASGSIEITTAGITADFAFKAKAPSQRLTEVVVANFGTVREGYDGKVAWSVNPATGPTDKSGKELARIKREATFNRELQFKNLYSKLEVTGSTKIQDRDVWLLKATTAENDVESFAFDAKTGLLIRQQATVEGPNGLMDTEVMLEDYREVDGIKVPFLIRMVAPPEMTFQIRFKEFRHNQSIPDSEFKRPAN